MCAEVSGCFWIKNEDEYFELRTALAMHQAYHSLYPELVAKSYSTHAIIRE